jgi:hypothetical protein
VGGAFRCREYVGLIDHEDGQADGLVETQKRSGVVLAAFLLLWGLGVGVEKMLWVDLNRPRRWAGAWFRKALGSRFGVRSFVVGNPRTPLGVGEECEYMLVRFWGR